MEELPVAPRNKRQDRSYVVIDEVQVMPWSDGHCVTATLLQFDVCLVQCLVDIHKPVDNGLSMAGRDRQIREHNRNVIRRDVLRGRGRERERERERERVNTVSALGRCLLTSDLSKSTLLVNSYPT